LELNAQVLGALGYKRPGYFDKDDAALDVLFAILGQGKGGLAWRELVEEKKLAAALQIAPSYPDGLYPNLFLFLYAPSPGHSVEEVQKGIEDLIARFRIQKVAEDILNDAEAQTQSRAYQRLAGNETAAEMLAVYTATYGEWKRLFTTIEDTTKITPEDVLRVAQRHLIPANRTSVYTVIPGLPSRTPRTGGLQ
jgi:predicted Zn-dependent peptidase